MSSAANSPCPPAWRWSVQTSVQTALLVAAAAGVAYHNSFSVPLLFDDLAAIATNRSITNLRNLGAVFAPPEDAPTAGRPLLNLSFALNYAANGLRVRGYHVVNLLLHVCAGLALCGVIRRTLRSGRVGPLATVAADRIALAAALIWVAHPLQTASVTYISQRAEVLAALFFLLTVYAFARMADRSSGGWAWASVTACAAGMMSKETMVTAPLVVLLHDRIFFAGTFGGALRRRPHYYAALAGTWVLLAALMWSTHVTRRGIGYAAEVGALNYALTQTRVVLDYLKLSIWPQPLVFDYGPEIIVRAVAAIWREALVLAALIGATIVALRRMPAVGFLGAVFCILLAPTSSVVPVIHQPMAENRMYLPLAAVATLLASAICVTLRHRAWAVIAVTTLALCTLAARRNLDYRDARALWADTVAKQPRNVRAHSFLGEVLRHAGETGAAERAFLAALRLNPDFGPAHNNLGVIYQMQPGRIADALAHYEAARRALPGSAAVHNNLGVLLSRIQGREAEALACYRAAIRVDQGFADAHKNLATALMAMPGHISEALNEYAIAARLAPADADARTGLGAALAASGRLREAAEALEAALRLNPRHASAHVNLGNVRLRLGRTPAAVMHYRQATELEPAMAEAWLNLGVVYSTLPGYENEAIAALTEALRLQPALTRATAIIEQLQAR